MKSIFRICIPAAGLLAGIATAQQRYTITELKPLPGGNFSQAFSVNNTGLMGGQSNITDATQRAVIWPRGTTTPTLIGPVGVNSAAFGINERGQVEVQSEIGDKDPYLENFCGYGTDRKCQPFLWQNFVLTPLALLGGITALSAGSTVEARYRVGRKPPRWIPTAHCRKSLISRP